MIKFKLLLVTPLVFSLITKGKTPDIFQYKNAVDEIIASPHSGSSFNITIYASSTVAEYRKITCLIFNPNTNLNETLFSYIFLGKEVEYSKKVECHINWENPKITINLNNKRVSPLHSVEFELKKVQKNINAANYDYEPFSTDANTYYYFHNNSKYVSEKYTFKNITYIFKPETGYCYDISSLNLLYSILEPLIQFNCQKITFYVDNTLHYFDEIRDDNITGTGCEITLECIKSSGLRFQFKDQMYVNPLTLHMSKKQHDGYVKTNKFYFPVDYFNNKESELIIFTLYECGLNRVTISLPFEFTVRNKYYGDCANSDYCLNSKSSEPDFELGKTIEHE